MATSNTPRLFKFESETLRAYYTRAQVHFDRHEVKEETYKSYDFLTGLPDRDFARVSQAILPKTIADVKWVDLERAIKKLEVDNTNHNRLKFAALQRLPGQDIAQYADQVNALSLSCNWETTTGGEAVRQLKFLTSFSEPHILEALLKLGPESKFEEMVNTACNHQAIFENARASSLTPSVAPLSARAPVKRQLQNSGQSQNKGEEVRRSGSGVLPRCGECFSTHEPSRCPKKNWLCRRCRKKGHIEVVCRSKQAAVLEDSEELSDAGEAANAVNSLYIYNGEGVCKHTTSPVSLSSNPLPPPQRLVASVTTSIPYSVDVQLRDLPYSIPFVVDTGASVSLVDISRLPPKLYLGGLAPYRGRVHAANGEILPVLGVWKTQITIANKAQHVSLLVTRNMSPKAIVGRDLLQAVAPAWRGMFDNIFKSSVEVVARVAKINKTIPPGDTQDSGSFSFHQSAPEVTPQNFPKLFPCAFGLKGNHLPMKGFIAQLNLKEGATPVFHRARPVALSLKKKLATHFEDLLRAGVVYKVSDSDWASPLVVVEKPDGGLRVCVDFKRTVNPHLRSDIYPPPLPEDIFIDFEDCEFFCKVDLSNAYLQMEVHSSSQQLLTVNTPIGLVRYRRLVFGLKPAPAIFQAAMDRLFFGLKRVRAYLDDVLIGGRTLQECTENALKVLGRLNAHNIKVNERKSVWFEKAVSFLGYIISKQGKTPDPRKVDAIQKMRPPENVPELRSFIGMVNFYRSFIGNFSSMLEPFYILLRKGTSWSWSEECQKVFDAVKSAVASATSLVVYDPSSELVLTTDSSAYGVGAVLSQRVNGILKPVAFESATLTPAQRNYSQLHKEALAIIFGLQKFHKYLYGRKFTIECDHQPLRALLAPDSCLPAIAAARMIRWAEILSAYDYRIMYCPGKQIPQADVLSRLPSPSDPQVAHVAFVQDSSPLLSLAQIREATGQDSLLQQLCLLLTSRWGSKPVEAELQKFFTVRDHLAVERGVVFFGRRAVIPRLLRAQVLRTLHSGHIGITRMREAARGLVWWPGLDQDLVNVTQGCIPCNQHAARNPDDRFRQGRPAPGFPWERVHLDFFELEGSRFLVVVDAFSNWVHVEEMPSATATKVIHSLKCLMATFGLFSSVVSDNGPPFNSSAFRDFLAARGIAFLPAPPFNPQSNGRAESGVHRAKQGLRKAASDMPGAELSDRILHFMSTQHAAPSSTAPSPMERLLRYTPRTHLTAMLAQSPEEIMENRKGDAFPEASLVWVLPYPLLKHPRWEPGVVVRCQSDCIRIVRTSGNSIHRVHVGQLRARREVGAPSACGTPLARVANKPVFFPGNGSMGPYLPATHLELAGPTATQNSSPSAMASREKTPIPPTQQAVPPILPPLTTSRSSGRQIRPPGWMKDYVSE